MPKLRVGMPPYRGSVLVVAAGHDLDVVEDFGDDAAEHAFYVRIVQRIQSLNGLMLIAR